MKSIWKRGLLALLFFGHLSTLLLDWQVIEGLTSRNGLLVLTGNILLSCIITGLYFVSLLFFQKQGKRFSSRGSAHSVCWQHSSFPNLKHMDAFKTMQPAFIWGC